MNRGATVIRFPVLADPRDYPHLFGDPAFAFILLSLLFTLSSLRCYSSEEKPHTVPTDIQYHITAFLSLSGTVSA